MNLINDNSVENKVLLLENLGLKRINSSLRSELIRYELMFECYEKLINILNQNNYEFEEKLLKQKLIVLKSIKKSRIDLKRIENNFIYNKEVINESESDFDLNDNNFDENSIHSENNEFVFELIERKPDLNQSIDTNVCQTNGISL